ncbi:MAG: sulfite exporter TauE/SafE family protein [Candidatus Eremiobacteraeota bacterium]|nr:sulfite exporter TauE/SafE family protein [Candidatus Eremiobacteraeota bacterium]
MFDPINVSLQAIALGRPSAFALVFVAGAATSVGPCAAPRLIAISGLNATGDKGGMRANAAAFVSGLIVAYASFGVFASLLGRVTTFSHWIYIALGMGLAAGAVATLTFRRGEHSHDVREPTKASPGAAFLLGGSFAFVVSPCCTPLVVGILAYCSQIHNAMYGAGLLSVFALGHAVPIVALASGTALISRALRRLNLEEALRVVGGALMLALSGYYLCLA